MVVSGRVRVKFKLPRDGGLCAVVCPILFNLRQFFSAFDLSSSNFITMSTYLPIRFRLDSIFPPRFLSSVSRQHALPSPKTLPFRESAMFVCHLASNNLHLIRGEVAELAIQCVARFPRMEVLQLLLQVEC